MEIEELKSIGLSQGEIRVYSAILHKGLCSINNIHEQTGFERRAIYDILNKLIEKGFATYTVEKGKKKFQCSNPGKLTMEIKKRQEELKKLEQKIHLIDKIYKEKKPNINIEIFRGKEGIKAVFEEMLNYKDNYFIGGGYYIMNLLPNYWPQYNERRIIAGVRWYSLGRFETMKEEVPEKKLLYVKYLPKEFSGSPTVIFIFGNKIVNVLWGDALFAFMIESKEISENYLKYFKYLWKNVASQKN